MAKKPPPPYHRALILAASEPGRLTRQAVTPASGRPEDVDVTALFALEAVPGLVWAGYLTRDSDVVALTERGRAVLERQRIGRPRLPAPVQTEIGTGQIWAAPSLPCEGEEAHVEAPSSAPTVQLVIEHLAAAGFGALAARPEEGEVTITKAPGTRSLKGIGTVTVHGDRIIAITWDAGWCRATTLDPDGIPPWRFEVLLRRAAGLRARGEARRSKSTPPEQRACTRARAVGLVRAAGLQPELVEHDPGAIEVRAPGGPKVGALGFHGDTLVDLEWITPWGKWHSVLDLSGLRESSVIAWLEPWLERQRALGAAPAPATAPAPAISNEPPSLITAVRAAATAAQQDLEVTIDATRQRKAAPGVACWKITTAAYKGGRILARLEIHPDHVRLDGRTVATLDALEMIRARLEAL